MDGKKFAKILTGVIVIIFGFFAKIIALESYGREEKLLELMSLLMIIFGIADIIVALAEKSENKSSNNTIHNQKQQSNSMIIICPYCGEENSIRNENCIRCHRIINTHTPTDNISTDGWVCPKCKNVNAKYVGTCGCGERKPE